VRSDVNNILYTYFRTIFRRFIKEHLRGIQPLTIDLAANKVQKVDVRILVLTSYPDNGKIFQSIKAGAVGI